MAKSYEKRGGIVGLTGPDKKPIHQPERGARARERRSANGKEFATWKDVGPRVNEIVREKGTRAREIISQKFTKLWHAPAGLAMKFLDRWDERGKAKAKSYERRAGIVGLKGPDGRAIRKPEAGISAAGSARELLSSKGAESAPLSPKVIEALSLVSKSVEDPRVQGVVNTLAENVGGISRRAETRKQAALEQIKQLEEAGAQQGAVEQIPEASEWEKDSARLADIDVKIEELQRARGMIIARMNRSPENVRPGEAAA